jgi:hypothetical protein
MGTLFNDKECLDFSRALNNYKCACNHRALKYMKQKLIHCKEGQPNHTTNHLWWLKYCIYM